MASELSYVLITPYSLRKSRTGGIITRLLFRTGLELAGAQIITPDYETCAAFANSIRRQIGKTDEVTAKIFSDYVMDNFTPLPDGRKARLMLLLFRGEDACRRLYSVVGGLPTSKNRKGSLAGETIRDTYCDLVYNRDGSLQYFEPAVFTPPDAEGARERLAILAKFLKGQENIVSGTIESVPGAERTLAIIKPDNWNRPSVRPGGIIDMFSRTSLRIMGCKVYRMSVAQALDFYGPVRDALRQKLSGKVGEEALELLEEHFGIELSEGCADTLRQTIGNEYAEDQFNRIVGFMSGRRPDHCRESELNEPGLVKCMALVYEGPDAIRKIREVLGPTDPTKAPEGTVRREFGTDVMVNSAHASDSKASYERESQVIRIDVNDLGAIIEDSLK